MRMKKIKDTDEVRIMDRCYYPTKYYSDGTGKGTNSATKFPCCVYLKDNKCTLQTCVRRNM